MCIFPEKAMDIVLKSAELFIVQAAEGKTSAEFWTLPPWFSSPYLHLLTLFLGLILSIAREGEWMNDG